MLAISERSVRRWETHFNKHGDVKDQPHTGRPKITDEQTDTNIALTAIQEKFISARGIKRKLDLDVSIDTVDRRLKEAGLPERVAQHKRRFTEEDKAARLAFAHKYKDWSNEQWMSVWWADETFAWGEGHSGRIYVRRPVGEADNPEYCVHKLPHAVKVGVWGCFSGRGLGYCYLYNTTLTGAKYKEILSTHLLPSVRLFFADSPPEKWYFVHDNYNVHQSLHTWLFNHGVDRITIPPYSPDLNPIENLWYLMHKRMETKNATTMEEVQDAFAEEWDKVSKEETEFLQHCVCSMQKRCADIIAVDGDHIHY
jgi:transposase